MNGYSVTEAATVLGVPTERVWELLARGVLAGAPEGENGMRVFLQPRQAPAPIATPDEPAASNGPDREMSPFRELLTEFRNLTERYGQALLALGESRGEVASLRSRVDLLEARIDLRLPMGAPAASPWPTQPLPVGTPPTEAAPPAEAEPPAEPEPPSAGGDHPEESQRPRSRGARRAIESFAEAMARTEDPSPADLPPIAAVVGAQATEPDDADHSLPRAVLPAEPMLVADDAEAGMPEAATVEEPPEPLADAVGPSVADLEPIVEEPAAAVEPDAAATDEFEEQEPRGTDAVDEPMLEAAEAESWTEPEPRTEPVAWAEPESGESATEEQLGAVEPGETIPDQPAEAEAPVAAQPADEPVEFDEERYSAVIEQPDWFEAEADDDWPSAPSSEPTGDAPRAEAAFEPDGGADEMEVAGGGGATSPAEDAAEVGLPGSRELDEALDAYGEIGRRAEPAPGAEDEWPPRRGEASPTWAPSDRSVAFRADAQPRAYGSVTHSGPANRAYRRLRRIFPS